MGTGAWMLTRSPDSLVTFLVMMALFVAGVFVGLALFGRRRVALA